MAPHKEAALNWSTILGNLLGGGQEGDDAVGSRTGTLETLVNNVTGATQYSISKDCT